MKVLIADDDPATRQITCHLMAKAGFQVVVAADGKQALELAQTEQPEIVLTDWMMPGIEGVDLCRQLRAAAAGKPYIYILLLTVRDRKEDIALALDAGADDYIIKPFDPQEMLARVNAGVRIIRLETQLRKRNEELEQSLTTIRQLKSLLPVCMYCKKVRNDQNYWQQLDSYIREQTGTDFSHGICPDCLKKHHPEYAPTSPDKAGQSDNADPAGGTKPTG